MADALDAVSPDVASRTKNLLAAVASGGTQGLRAYEQGEAALRQAKTDAIGRAQQRAGLIGGPEAQGFEAGVAGQFDRRLGDMANSRTGFESYMASLGSAHKNYLDQVAAAVPLVRADTSRQVALKRASIEADLAEQLAKQAAKGTDDISLDSLLGKAGQIQTAAKPTGPVDFGPAQMPGESIEAYLARLEARAQARRDTDKIANMPQTDLAAEIGRQLGVPSAKLDELYSPSKQSSLLNARENLAPPTDTNLKNIAGWANVDTAAAKKIADDPKYVEVREYGYAWADPSAYSLDKKGKIKGEDKAYNGKSPWEAFLVDIAGITGPARTALINEFGPLFSQLGLK